VAFLKIFMGFFHHGKKPSHCMLPFYRLSHLIM
jgi:hypothetical protein